MVHVMPLSAETATIAVVSITLDLNPTRITVVSEIHVAAGKRNVDAERLAMVQTLGFTSAVGFGVGGELIEGRGVGFFVGFPDGLPVGCVEGYDEGAAKG